MKLGFEDQRHFEAAEGWLSLGNPIEANGELECISPRMRAHPDVLWFRWKIYAAAKKYELAVEAATVISEINRDVGLRFIHMAYALHKLKRTEEARAVLLHIGRA